MNKWALNKVTKQIHEIKMSSLMPRATSWNKIKYEYEKLLSVKLVNEKTTKTKLRTKPNYKR